MISAHDRTRIAVHIVANPRTVQRVYQGKGSEYSRLRVAEAARALGLPEPPTPSSKDSPEPSSTNSNRAA